MMYDFDPTEDAQNMSTFEAGEGKEFFEQFIKKKLSVHEKMNNHEGVSI